MKEENKGYHWIVLVLVFFSQVIMMKIDFSGLESTAASCGPNSELFDGISTAPSFQIPSTTDVSLSCLFLILIVPFAWEEIRLDT